METRNLHAKRRVLGTFHYIYIDLAHVVTLSTGADEL